MNTKRQPKGIPTGGEFAANDHEEASASLAATTTLTKLNDRRYIPGVSEGDDDMTDAEWFEAMGEPTGNDLVDHGTLMDIEEIRMMPSGGLDVGDIKVERDENAGTETVTAKVGRDQWGNARDYGSDEDRVAFLVDYDGVTASAHRVEAKPDEGGEWGGASRYSYEVSLHNPYTDETIMTPFHTGSAHQNTPETSAVLASMVSDAASVHGCTLEEWAEENGLEPDWDEAAEGGDQHHKYRRTFEECQRSDQVLQDFLGRRYEDYMWGNYGNGTLNVTFEDKD